MMMGVLKKNKAEKGIGSSGTRILWFQHSGLARERGGSSGL